MKKRINKIGFLLALSLLSLWACDDQYNSPGTEPSHVYATTSFGDSENKLQVNGYMTFIDLSRGVASRTWNFTDDAFDINNQAIPSTTEDVVKVKFTQAGVHQIELSQSFINNVWVGQTQQQTASYDTLISVTVLDSVKASFNAVQIKEGTDLVNADNALNEVYAGREILFSQTTAELMGATNFLWYFTKEDGSKIKYEGAEINAKFSSVGKYDAMLIAYNEFSRDTIAYSSYLNIVASTDPVELLGLTFDGNLKVRFGRDMGNPSTCDPAAFSLTVSNNGIDVPVSVTGLSTDPNEENVIILQLSDQLYNSDDVLVSYDASVGDLITSDGMLADSFTDEKVRFITDNILATSDYDYGFEVYPTDNWKYLWWGGAWGEYTFEVSNAQAHNGKNSGHVMLKPAGGMIMGLKDAANEFITFPTESGKVYEISCWVYMESLGDGASTPDLRCYWSADTDWSVGGATFPADYQVGKWVYNSWRVNSPGTGNYGWMIRGDNQGNSQECSFYIDDWSMSVVDMRP